MGATKSEIVVEVPKGMSVSEIRKIVREIVLRYLREKGASEEELEKVRVRVEVLEE
ncbi:hypothetical protein [Thermococcus eurythermalis]|uniref:hypothetical protein n=1 Tax=Thermococcus eurythermalis TaxID=1505907 RepID=UPI000A94675A|nr:hypothetical protein [Thermococcus eurythermalis]